MAQAIKGFLEISFSALVPNPFEPPERLVADPALMKSLDTIGLLEPIVVAPIRGQQGRYVICVGHRRFAAARELGWSVMPCNVLDHEMDPAAPESLDLLLVENIARKDFDPVEEANLVAKLLERPGATMQMVGDALGRSVPWVSRRSNLATLSEKARDARAEGGVLDGWAASWLEELAILAPHQQDVLVDRFEVGGWQRPETLEHLLNDIQRELRPLRLAPWDLSDETLVPAVGSCKACPKTSCVVPTLFGDEAGPLDLKTATCRDARCFDAKRIAHVERQIEAAHEEHGKDLPLVREDYSEWRAGQKDGRAVLEPGKWEPVPKKKGGQPAILVDGPKAGEVVYMRPRKEITAAAPKSKADGAPTRRALRQLLEAVRHASLNACVCEVATDADAPPARILDVLLQARAMRGFSDIRAKFISRPTDRILDEGWELLKSELIQLVRSRQFETDAAAARADLAAVIAFVGFEWPSSEKPERKKAPAKKKGQKRWPGLRRAPVSA